MIARPRTARTSVRFIGSLSADRQLHTRVTCARTTASRTRPLSYRHCPPSPSI
jgi:hypothetical protein